MKGHCPKCGSGAAFVSQKPHTIDLSEALFRCLNPKCGAEIVAEVSFVTRKTPAEQCFSRATNKLLGPESTDC